VFGYNVPAPDFEKQCSQLLQHMVNFGYNKFECGNSYVTKGFVNPVWAEIKLMQRMVEFGYNVIFRFFLINLNNQAWFSDFNLLL
jgi:hypothetical protein